MRTRLELTGTVSCILLFFLFLYCANRLESTQITLDSISGEISGGCEKSSAPLLDQKIIHAARVTFCEGGDSYKDIVQLAPEDVNGKTVWFYTSGYFSDSVRLVFYLDNIPVTPIGFIASSSGENWLLQKFEFDTQFKSLKVELIDEGVGFKEWAGISLPVSRGWQLEAKSQLVVVMNVIVFLILAISLVYWVHTLIALFLKNDNLSSVLVFCILCLIYYAAFWLYYFHHNLGLAFSYILIMFGISRLVADLISGNLSVNLKQSASLMSYSGTIFYVSFLYLFMMSFGDIANIQNTAATIFSDPLPGDNFIPYEFANQIYNESLKSPMIGDWLSSDRPPLQCGMFLFYFKMFRGSEQGYQLFSMFLQATFIVPLAIFLNRVIKERYAKLIILLVICFSSVCIVNTVFVWPKLVAGAALLFILLVVIYEKNSVGKLPALLCCAVLAAVSMLAHSGIIFALPAVATICWFALKPGVKVTCISFLIFLAIFSPWIFYQKHLDPPGNRLAKWHLAGQVDINEDSLGESLLKAYSNKSYQEIVENKVSNFKYIFHDLFNLDFAKSPIEFFRNSGTYSKYLETVQSKAFFHFFYSGNTLFLFAIIGLILTFLKRATEHINELIILLGFVVISSVSWSFAMYENGATIIHQGPYGFWLCLLLLLSLLIYSGSKYLLYFAGTLFIFINLFVYFLPAIQASDDFSGILALASALFLLLFLSNTKKLFSLNVRSTNDQ